MRTEMIKTTIGSAIIGAVASGGMDAENNYIKVGSVVVMVATVAAAVWRIRGMFDGHNRQHEQLGQDMAQIKQIIAELPCRPSRGNASDGRSGDHNECDAESK